MEYSRSEAKDAAREQFHGVWAAVTLPLTEDLKVDEAGVVRNMRYLVDDLKVDGVFCTGIIGEFWSMTIEEWKRGIELVVQAAQGSDCRIIAHTGHHSADQTIELTRHAERAGADYAIMITPYFPGRTDQGVYEWFEYVCGRVDIGVWMFDAVYSGYKMPAELASQIADIENVCGMKQAWPMDHHQEVHRLCNDKIVLSQPNEANFLELMRDYGQQVHMSSPAPYLFQQPGRLTIREYTELARKGEWDKAAEVSKRLQPYRDLVASHTRATGKRGEVAMPRIAYMKEWTSIVGMASGPVRPPLVNLTQEERDEFRQAMKAVGVLEEVEGAATAP